MLVTYCARCAPADSRMALARARRRSTKTASPPVTVAAGRDNQQVGGVGGPAGREARKRMNAGCAVHKRCLRLTYASHNTADDGTDGGAGCV